MTLDGTEPQHDDGAVQALFRALAPYQPPGSQPQLHPGYGSCMWLLLALWCC
jgi:hypothetical protein